MQYLLVPCSTTAQVQDGDGGDKQWVKCLNCTIYTKYREGIMSRTTASNGSWTLIHYAQATYMTTPTVIIICTSVHQQFFQE